MSTPTAGASPPPEQARCHSPRRRLRRARACRREAARERVTMPMLVRDFAGAAGKEALAGECEVSHCGDEGCAAGRGAAQSAILPDQRVQRPCPRWPRRAPYSAAPSRFAGIDDRRRPRHARCAPSPSSRVSPSTTNGVRCCRTGARPRDRARARARSTCREAAAAAGSVSANAKRCASIRSRRHAVHVGGDTVDRRAVGAHQPDQYHRRPAVGREHLARDRQRGARCDAVAAGRASSDWTA